MKIARLFTTAGRSPYEGITFENRSSQLIDRHGNVTYSCDAIGVPSTWSQLATDIVAQKYFRHAGVDMTHPNNLRNAKYSKKWASGIAASELSGNQETDLRQTIHRMVGCWTDWGERFSYFSTRKDAQAFYDEMSYMIATQMFAPNSPQWFNTGLFWAYGITGSPQGHYYVDPATGELTKSTNAFEHIQASACFILSVKDDLVNDGGIFDLFTREARIFKLGSGAGSNYSAIRGENEPLAGGGKSSGLMSFLPVGDAGAGAIKSGGANRRAARMVILNADHPDIEKFVNWKVTEERKVVALAIGSLQMKNFWEELQKPGMEGDTLATVRKYRKLGVSPAFIEQCLNRLQQDDLTDDLKVYDTSWEGEGYQTVSGMNANNTVRVTDEFMKAVEADEAWFLTRRTDGAVTRSFFASELMDQINRASYLCGDPGLQFDTTINDWHTVPSEGRINASNPFHLRDKPVAQPAYDFFVCALRVSAIWA